MRIFKELVISLIKPKADILLSDGKARKVERAIRIYNKIIKMDETKTNVYWNKMIGHIILKEFDQALICVNKVIELEPGNAEFYNQKASLLCSRDLQRFEEAIDYYNVAIEIKNDYLGAYFGKGIALACLHKYDDAEALKLTKKAIELSYRTKLSLDIAYFTKSRIYAKMNLKDKCINNLSKAIKINNSFKDYVLKCEEFEVIKNDKNSIRMLSKI